MKIRLVMFASILMLIACSDKNDEGANPDIAYPTILDQLALNYQQMPEQEVIRSSDQRVYAQYAMPTEKYTHGILGDKIEAEQLVVVVDSVFYEVTLSSEFVFEDISPRLYDVDGDAELEFITIRTHVSQGAGIAIYKIIDGQLVEFAYVTEIGKANRWLNIVAINDLDDDGFVELVWIQTPHIGGVLKVAKIKAGALHVLDEKEPYSNHAIGERNLCLSVLSVHSNQKIFYVPNQSRDKIVGFYMMDNTLSMFEEITQSVDFSKPLGSQHNFSNAIETGNNCINGDE